MGVASSKKTGFASFVFIAVISIYLFLNSSYFTASGLEWTGLVLLTKAQMEDHTPFEPCNVLKIDRRALARQIEQHPWVEKAGVRWIWPNTMEVTVSERIPVAWVTAENGTFFLDKSGMLLDPLQTMPVVDLPQVVNLDLDSLEQRRAAARLVTALPPHIVSSLIKWDVKSQALVTESGAKILLGDLEDLQSKFALLELIWNDLSAQGIDPEVIDLRVLKNPVVRPR